MVHPTFITIIVGAVSMAVLLGIDWFLWGLTYRVDYTRKPETTRDSESRGNGFKKVA